MANIKTIDKTYLYSIYPTYEKSLFQFVMSADRIDVNDERFADIMYELKQRALTNNMIKAVMSNKIKMLYGGSGPVGKAVKVFTMKDVKESLQNRVTFIDVSSIISLAEGGSFKCSSIDALISHILNAITQVAYYNEMVSAKLTNNVRLTSIGVSAFTKLMFNIVDYIAKISSIPDAKEQCNILSALYYHICLLGREEINDSVIGVIKSELKVSERMITTTLLNRDKDDFINLKMFCQTLSDELRLPKITPEAITSKWMYVYDPSTTFGLELFPAFSAMLTDAYIGAYINNQKTIQKVLDTDMVVYTKELLRIEGGL